MSNIKYCPNCQKEHNIDETKCSCGYEFVMVEKVDETVSTNTTVIVDRVPGFLWSWVGFFSRIAGLILYIVWKKKWPERSKRAGSVALYSAIVLTVILVVVLLLIRGYHNGQVI